MNLIFKSQTKKSGFASTTLLLFLPLIMLIVFGFTFMSYLIQYKTKMRSRCLTEVISIQKNLILGEEKLFKLNPLARALRWQLKVAYVKFFAAMAVENLPLAAEIQLEINQIKSNQEKLDKIQKLIIKTTELNTNIRMTQLKYELSHLALGMQSLWSFYLETFTKVHLLKKAEIGVQPDDPDLAPIYELAPDYKYRQQMVYQWQHHFETKAEAQSLLQTENDFDMTCASSAQNERGLWTILINADKF